MAAEFYIVFDDTTWYERNRARVGSFIESLGTFRRNINDLEYWLRGDEVGGDWEYGVRLIMQPHDILLEISSHPASIVDDIKMLNKLISDHTRIRIVDEDGDGTGYD